MRIHQLANGFGIRKKLKLPYAPFEDEESDIRHDYNIETNTAHMVAEYAGISLQAVDALDIIDYYILRRDSFIAAMGRTGKGIKYLNDAWAREQTEPDRAMLRADFGQKGQSPLRNKQDWRGFLWQEI